jgi:hypothetical protein
MIAEAPIFGRRGRRTKPPLTLSLSFAFGLVNGKNEENKKGERVKERKEGDGSNGTQKK